MLNRVKKLFSKRLNQKNTKKDKSPKIEHNLINTRLKKNEEILRDMFANCSDIIFRKFQAGTTTPVDVLMIYVDGLTNREIISHHVLMSLMQQYLEANYQVSVLERAVNSVISMPEIKLTLELIDIVDAVLTGDVALLIENQEKALIISARGYESRNIGEPETETVIRGPRDGFTENLRTNTALVRRRIKTSRLKIEQKEVGVLTKTAVAVLYIEGVANDTIVEEVRQRLARVNIDGILESGYIEEFIEDSPWSPFPQVEVTERPDKVASYLLEGHVAIMVDTTPFTLIVPVVFIQYIQSPEDYYVRTYLASFLRILRFVTLNIALLLPSFYIAVTTFHQEMLPTPLIISIAQARAGVPFPALIEALLMELSFEIVREAGVRLPRPVGQAISIVGALVIGDAAVSAGLVSPAMLIVVALTAMSTFTLPSIHVSGTIRLLRFPIMLLAASLGLFGIMMALLVILMHLCSLRSFGVPFLSPIAPLSLRDLKDVPVRVPWWMMLARPRLIGYKEPQRQDSTNRLKPLKKRQSEGN